MAIISRFEQIEINHKFLVRGHTYHPIERDFTHIKKQKSDWEKIVREARHKMPFSVISIDSSKFHNFTELVK